MNAGDLRALLETVPDHYEVMTSTVHHTRQVDHFGQPPMSVMCGHVDLGCEVEGLTIGQAEIPYALLCIGDVVHSLSGSPCTRCPNTNCNAQPDEETEDV